MRLLASDYIKIIQKRRYDFSKNHGSVYYNNMNTESSN